MASHPDTHKPLPKLKTATEDLAAKVYPFRSRTEPPAPEQHHHEKSHLHRRLHSSSLRNRAFTSSREPGYRHVAKETVQSAIELKPPISFDALLGRKEKKSPDPGSRESEGRWHHHHRSQQSRGQQDIQQRQAEEWAEQQRQLAAKEKKVKAEDVAEAKRKNAQRERELQDSLKNVEEVAMRSTRQLDDTYYMILEKASLLRSTVASLQQLAEESRRLHGQFKEDTQNLSQETSKNLSGFGNFDGQEKTINQLVTRLSKSKDRTKSLNERLEAARNRVEAFEVREKERRKARRIQYSAIWAVVIGFLILIIGIMIAKKRSAVGTRLHKVAKVLDEFGHEVIISVASPVVAMVKPTASPSEDTYLKKLFDEL